MKKCTNRLCNAELEDYMERCPECGLLQKNRESKLVGSEPLAGSGQPEHVVRERHGFVTFWLWLVLVVNVFSVLLSLFPKEMYGSDYVQNPSWVYVLDAIMAGVNVLGAFLLLSWKKIGFLLIIMSSVISAAVAMLVFGSTLGIARYFIGVMFLSFVLNIKRNDISCWDCMD